MMMQVIALSVFLAAAPAPDENKVAKPTGEEIQKAQQQVTEALNAVKGNYARVLPITDDAVLQTFPKHLYFSVLFPQFPVGRPAPPGHSSSNVYVVARSGEGKPQFFSDAARLEAFFKSTLAPVRDDNQAKEGARAWVQLAAVFANDGFYKFVLMDEATRVVKEGTGREASAKLVVMAGGNGDIVGRLQINADGKLDRATVTANLKPGPRPICQATKLLDADPIVRKMAEQDLLIMGRAAKYYLDEQRAGATPELQRAIDRIWQRILAEER
jgi:hypothetical protein